VQNAGVTRIGTPAGGRENGFLGSVSVPGGSTGRVDPGAIQFDGDGAREARPTPPNGTRLMRVTVRPNGPVSIRTVSQLERARAGRALPNPIRGGWRKPFTTVIGVLRPTTGGPGLSIGSRHERQTGKRHIPKQRQGQRLDPIRPLASRGDRVEHLTLSSDGSERAFKRGLTCSAYQLSLILVRLPSPLPRANRSHHSTSCCQTAGPPPLLLSAGGLL
jgi:hypothetical protein